MSTSSPTPEPQARTRTRLGLHGVVELLLAGPQFATSGTIRLRVMPGGFGTVAAPDVRVQGTELIGPTGRHPLSGTTYAQLGAVVGVRPRSLGDVYSDSVSMEINDEVDLDLDHLQALCGALATGDHALRLLAPQETPTLWPEHFDVGITLEQVNYGVSPGDSHLNDPYAYVGPWQPRSGEFWGEPFGAARLIADVPDVDGVLAFFKEGQLRAAMDPPIDSGG
jgi:hypothetical protein